jgi:hypothetical protein
VVLAVREVRPLTPERLEFFRAHHNRVANFPPAMVAELLEAVEKLQTETARLRNLARYLRSVVQSGEGWTDTCEKAFAGSVHEGHHHG